MERTPKIEFRDVHLAYGDKIVLKGVNFRVEPGEMKVILGQSGSGKSTILRLAIGLLKPDAGQIFINGEEISDLSEEELSGIRQRMSFVFQEGALFDSLTVYDNVAYRPRELRWEPEEIEARVREVLEFVDLLEVSDQLPGELSGGTRRRVAHARAIVDRPQIMLYDEPTVGLDPPTAHKLCEAAVRLRDLSNVTSMFVTHKLDDLHFLSSRYALPPSGRGPLEDKSGRLCLINVRFIMLNQGSIIFDGTEEQMQMSEDHYIRSFFDLDEEDDVDDEEIAG
jgi:phospholipid/cholesterol/gamma-HCH transport system ATP-binding protein